MKAKRIRSIIVYILIVLVAAAVVVLRASDHSEEQAREDAAIALAEARRPYLAERAEVASAIALIDAQGRGDAGHVPTLHLLFAEPDARIMTDAVPLMESYGYVAMVAVSEDAFPGDEGCLTVEQLTQLTAQGWGVCLSAGADTDIPALHARMLAAGIAAPQAVYFPDGDGTLENEEAILSLGIPVVIQYGAPHPADAKSGALRYLVARGTLDSANSAAFDSAMAGRTGMVLTEGWQRSRELFTQSDFQANLEFFEEYENSGQAKVMAVGAAHEEYVAAEAAWQQSEQDRQKRREELAKRLEELDAILSDLSLGR